MSNEEILNLYRVGDPNALEELYNNNFQMIKKLSRAFSWGADPEDLQQQSYFAVKRAADTYDPTRGATFLTYVIVCIKSELKRYIASSGGPVKLSERMRSSIYWYQQLRESLEKRTGHAPTAQELQQATGLRAQTIEKLQAGAEALRGLSVNAAGADDAAQLLELIPDPNDPIERALDSMQAEHLSRVLWETVAQLNSEQAEIITERYRQGMTYKAIAEEHLLSPAKVKQMETQALKRLRTDKYAKRLRPFAELSPSAESAAYKGRLSLFRRTGFSSTERAAFRDMGVI